MGPKAPTIRHLGLVPIRYRKSSGLVAERFYLHDAWHEPFRYILDRTGRSAVRIRPAASCELNTPDGHVVVLVDIRKHPVLADALLLMGQLFSVGIRTVRYTTLYKAYECLEAKPEIEFAVVRHALSHAASKLSRPRTLAVLWRLFGGTRIDFENSAHVRTFYGHFVRLLVEVDRRIYDAVWGSLASFRVVDRRHDLLHAWRIRGIPGLEAPIPIRERKRRAPSIRPLQPAAKQRQLFE